MSKEPELKARDKVIFWMSEKEFRATLTPKQLDIYLNCIIGGQSKIDYIRMS